MTTETTTTPTPTLRTDPIDMPRPLLRDRWADVDIPPALAHAGRIENGEVPMIDRPESTTRWRSVFVASSVVAVATSVALAGLVAADGEAAATGLRLAVIAVALSVLAATGAFGGWAFHSRRTIDALRWKAFRRPLWGGWWSVVWALTTPVAFAVFVLVEATTSGVVWTTFVAVGLLAVRAMSLRALGTNVKRVVLGPYRWLRLGAALVAMVDFVTIVVVWAALVEPRIDRGALDTAATLLPPLVLLGAVFSVFYARRVERWILEWWDTRWGCTEEDALDAISEPGFFSGTPDDFEPRSLLPTAPLRFLVLFTYVALALTTLWSGWTVWNIRGGLGGSDTLAESFARLDAVAAWFLFALFGMQAAHGLWCIAQSWNARRCTIGAPSVRGTATLFLPAPAMVGAGLLFVDDLGLLAVVVTFAVAVNLACFALSFGLLARILESLDASTVPVVGWFTMINAHWVLMFVMRPVVGIDDPDVFAGIVLAVAVIDAGVFTVAGTRAAVAMLHVERAAEGYEQIRRRPVVRQRRGDARPGGLLRPPMPTRPSAG